MHAFIREARRARLHPGGTPCAPSSGRHAVHAFIRIFFIFFSFPFSFPPFFLSFFLLINVYIVLLEFVMVLVLTTHDL